MQKIGVFNQLDVPLSAHIKVDGKNYLYFGGTAYLGIPQNNDFIKLYLEGIKRFGLNNGTSRSNNVQLAIYDEAEKEAAARFGSEAALIASSGFLAAQFIIKEFAGFGTFRYAPQAHPALWQNNDPKTKGTFSNWTTAIVKEINESKTENWVLISNSMNNLYPEIYDFSFIKNIGKHKKVLLVVDDSHGIGINNNGGSVFPLIPKCKNVEVLVIASMAKALGVDAGLILGPQKLIETLKNNNFLGASPPSAAGLFAFKNGTKIYATEWEKLQENITKVDLALTKKSDWHFVPDFPVFLSKKEDLSEMLLKQNILISSFPYPDQNGTVINRIVLSSWHSKADINKLILSL